MSLSAAVSDIYNSIHESIYKLLQHNKLPINTVIKENRKIVSSLKAIEHTARATFEAESLATNNEGAEVEEEAEVEAEAEAEAEVEVEVEAEAEAEAEAEVEVEAEAEAEVEAEA